MRLWKAPQLFADKRHKGTEERAERVAELERLVGRLTMELEIAKSIRLAGVTLEGQRAMIEQLKDSYPVKRIYAVLDCPRSSYYYSAKPSDDGALVEAIKQLLLRKPFFGYRCIAAQLRCDGRTVNTKVIRRILKELGVQRKVG